MDNVGNREASNEGIELLVSDGESDGDSLTSNVNPVSIVEEIKKLELSFRSPIYVFFSSTNALSTMLLTSSCVGTSVDKKHTLALNNTD